MNKSPENTKICVAVCCEINKLPHIIPHNLLLQAADNNYEPTVFKLKKREKLNFKPNYRRKETQQTQITTETWFYMS